MDADLRVYINVGGCVLEIVTGHLRQILDGLNIKDFERVFQTM